MTHSNGDANNNQHTRNQGIKKSRFPAQSTIPSDATFDFVSNGHNIKITIADFLTALGVTGALAQSSANGSPVLDDQGAVKVIRNILPGFGISTSIDGENNIVISTDFSFNEVGVALVDDPSASSAAFRSLVAGTGITIGGSPGQIQIAASGAPATTKTVLISQESDFPTPSGGVITLANDTDYFLINDVSLANRFVFGTNTQIRSTSTVIGTLTYTGTGIMFSGEDINIRLRNITIATTNSAASFFAVTSSTSAGIGILFADNVIFSGATFGSISCRILSLNQVALILSVGGITITATTSDVVSITGATWIQSAGIGLNLGAAVISSISVTEIFATVASGATLISGLVNSGNISTTGKGSVIDLTFGGAGTELVNIGPDDTRWQFFDNNTIINTRTDGLISLQGNTTVTPTAAAGVGVPVLIVGSWVVESVSQMSGTVGGRMTLDTAKGARLPMGVTLTLHPFSGGSQDVSAYIAINGVVVANSKRTTSASASNPDSLAVIWQESLSPNDFIEVFVSNDSSATDILVSSAVFRIN